jgi:hypothetical protein
MVVDQIQGVLGNSVEVHRHSKLQQRMLSKSSLMRRFFWKLTRLLSRKFRISLSDFWVIESKRSRRIELLDYCDDWFFAEYVRANEIELDLSLFHLRVENQYADEIVVHLRIGDYLKHPEIYSLVNEKYYFKAMEIIRKREKKSNLPFTILCENYTEAYEHYPRLVSSSRRVISRDGQLSDIESFEILLRANHLVASNSTYSMWAAWLGIQRRKNTIVPRDVSLNGNQSGLLELGWLILDAQTGEIVENRPYSTWFIEKQEKFHAIISTIAESSQN